ncbi:MAG: universal stress protein [Cyclobacteriaceae bacterium]|nr:universal stress protein [Cyclobacteriaceae bacterium]
MKKILCPTDFSETADQAIAYAAKLCKKVGAELTLLNVQSILSLPLEEVIKGKYMATATARHRLEDQSYKVMQVFKISCLSEVEPSNKSLSEIIAARAHDFNLIVMGTNGADDYYQFFVGSNSYQVARDASIPVLLVPNSHGYEDISTVVFAFDYEHEQKLPLSQLEKWVKWLGARTTILQVKGLYTREAEVNAKAVEQSIKSQTEITDIQFDTIYSDDVIDAINNYVVRNKTDMLALCSLSPNLIQTLFHKSVIKKLSSYADYPLFIFHQ